jgi:hypothetical protein
MRALRLSSLSFETSSTGLYQVCDPYIWRGSTFNKSKFIEVTKALVAGSVSLEECFTQYAKLENSGPLLDNLNKMLKHAVTPSFVDSFKPSTKVYPTPCKKEATYSVSLYQRSTPKKWTAAESKRLGMTDCLLYSCKTQLK